MVRSKWVVVSHGLEHVVIDQFLGLLEVKLVGACITDFFSVISKQVEERLEDSGHLDDVPVCNVDNIFLPLLWSNGMVLVITMFAIIRGWGTSAISASACSCSCAFPLQLL